MRFPQLVKLFSSALVLFTLVLPAFSATRQAPRVYFLDGALLADLRAEMISHPGSVLGKQITKSADKAMKVGPCSVTMKNRVPPSGDKHDYLSMAPYFWPDPTSPNGLPYIRRDGERNPEAAKIPDRDYIVDVINSAYTLSVGYYLTGNDKYADRAALLLRTWFLDPATRMNPNMNYGQYIDGVNSGRGAGLIETRWISEVVDSIGLLAGSKAWTTADDKAMHAWMADYFEWLQTSKNGRHEAAAPNNHGAWYEQQLAAVALYLGKDDFVRDLLRTRTTARIANQIDSEGKQRYELVRTKALHYSSFNLLALLHLERIGDAVGVDLWNYSTADGRSTRKALDWLLPYVAGEKKWNYKQIADFDFDTISPVLMWSAMKFNDARYEAVAERFARPTDEVDELILREACRRKFALQKEGSAPREQHSLHLTTGRR